MHLRSWTYLVLVLVGFLLLAGCKKTADPSSQPAGNSFTWTYMGVNYSGKENLASVYSFGPYTVVAGMDRNSIGINMRLSFTLNSFNTGAYSVGNGSNNKFNYVDDSGTGLSGTSGNVTITTSSNKLLSGNFSCTLLGPSNTTSLITGSFTNVPVK